MLGDVAGVNLELVLGFAVDAGAIKSNPAARQIASCARMSAASGGIHGDALLPTRPDLRLTLVEHLCWHPPSERNAMIARAHPILHMNL